MVRTINDSSIFGTRQYQKWNFYLEVSPDTVKMSKAVIYRLPVAKGEKYYSSDAVAGIGNKFYLFEFRIGGFGDRLKLVREDARMSHAQFGDSIGVGRSTVIRYEKELTFPDLVIIEKIAKRYGIDPCWLAFGRPFYQRFILFGKKFPSLSFLSPFNQEADYEYNPPEIEAEDEEDGSTSDEKIAMLKELVKAATDEIEALSRGQA